MVRIVKNWMGDAHFLVIEWSSRSDDLNIIENIWTMLEDIIYALVFLVIYYFNLY